jgi:hypothetical protein
MLDDDGLSKICWAAAVSVVVYLMNRTLTSSVVDQTLDEAWHGSGRTPSLNHLRVFKHLAFGHVLKEKRKKLNYRATPGIVFGYNISTKRYFVYDPLTRMVHLSQHRVFREGTGYTAPNAADEVFLNNHFYRDIIEEPKPTE